MRVVADERARPPSATGPSICQPSIGFGRSSTTTAILRFAASSITQRHRRVVGVEADADVGEIHDEGVDAAEHVGRRAAVSRRRGSGWAARSSSSFSDSTCSSSRVPRMPCSGLNSATRFDARRLVQDVDGARAAAIEPGVIGERARTLAAFERRELVAREHVDAGEHRGRRASARRDGSVPVGARRRGARCGRRRRPSRQRQPWPPARAAASCRRRHRGGGGSP